MTRLAHRHPGDEGATAVEYGIMVALVAAVIIAVVVVIGRQVKEGYCATADDFAGLAAAVSTTTTDC